MCSILRTAEVSHQSKGQQSLHIAHMAMQACTATMNTLREASATVSTVSANEVRRSSLTNWLSWEWVRLQKKTCTD